MRPRSALSAKIRRVVRESALKRMPDVTQAARDIASMNRPSGTTLMNKWGLPRTYCTEIIRECVERGLLLEVETPRGCRPGVYKLAKE